MTRLKEENRFCYKFKAVKLGVQVITRLLKEESF